MFKEASLIKLSDVENITVSEELLKKVGTLMTPAELLSKEEFELPEAIFPPKYPSFNELKTHRDRIRRLQLLPVKKEGFHEYYNALPKDQLLKDVYCYLEDSPITLAINAFPYWLPEDLKQYLIWTREQEMATREITKFIAQAITSMEITDEEVIIFERPKQTTSRLVKGTFPHLRHIHFWAKDTRESSGK